RGAVRGVDVHHAVLERHDLHVDAVGLHFAFAHREVVAGFAVVTAGLGGAGKAVRAAGRARRHRGVLGRTARRRRGGGVALGPAAAIAGVLDAAVRAHRHRVHLADRRDGRGGGGSPLRLAHAARVTAHRRAGGAGLGALGARSHLLGAARRAGNGDGVHLAPGGRRRGRRLRLVGTGEGDGRRHHQGTAEEERGGDESRLLHEAPPEREGRILGIGAAD